MWQPSSFKVWRRLRLRALEGLRGLEDDLQLAQAIDRLVHSAEFRRALTFVDELRLMLCVAGSLLEFALDLLGSALHLHLVVADEFPRLALDLARHILRGARNLI